ncbi:MAG: hypothetical protein K0R82_2713 [Flavipsychrobacter sp.]|nr:hypothetical protein [Flavipsychrobacter sp.]
MGRVPDHYAQVISVFYDNRRVSRPRKNTGIVKTLAAGIE